MQREIDLDKDVVHQHERKTKKERNTPQQKKKKNESKEKRRDNRAFSFLTNDEFPLPVIKCGWLIDMRCCQMEL